MGHRLGGGAPSSCRVHLSFYENLEKPIVFISRWWIHGSHVLQDILSSLVRPHGHKRLCSCSKCLLDNGEYVLPLMLRVNKRHRWRGASEGHPKAEVAKSRNIRTGILNSMVVGCEWQQIKVFSLFFPHSWRRQRNFVGIQYENVFTGLPPFANECFVPMFMTFISVAHTWTWVAILSMIVEAGRATISQSRKSPCGRWSISVAKRRKLTICGRLEWMQHARQRVCTTALCDANEVP